MPENRQVFKNAGSNPSGDNIEEAIRRLKISSNRDRDAAAQSMPYPDRPGEPDCLYYLRTGMCGYGSNCRYNHPANVSLVTQYGEELPERVGQPDCEYFLKTGTCKYGSTCKYHHPKDRRGAAPVVFNTLGLPMRQEEKSCPYYMRTGSCKFGVACKFHHPQQAAASFGAYPAAASPPPTAVTSSGFPYAGGFPAWSVPRMSYLSGQGIQSYVPPFMPSTQSIMPALNWSNYMGSISPAMPTGFLGSNLVYDYMNPAGDTLSGGQGVNSFLPDRPDQPECKYFMSTGTCKYGSDCKFHHPKERIGQSLSINPLGLPMRPGNAICSYYRIYGVCKFGPTCKFDHPVVAIPQNYALPSPTLSVFDTSLNTPRRISPVQQAETSPSKQSTDKLQQSDTKAATEEDSSKQADNTTSNSRTPPSESESLHE
ncbi:zinc finger CCCH domain-containing protein 3-like [Vicia villosa]|uniref:zinc finger CCCH domain-containing protein 3-like n=1 Tax=Vicia villosa TaxID=3911 RepID=UPI00273C2E55|nr:zinc finger CCCH domain-containing protein 3-like [Vicia villosa]